MKRIAFILGAVIVTAVAFLGAQSEKLDYPKSNQGQGLA